MATWLVSLVNNGSTVSMIYIFNSVIVILNERTPTFNGIIRSIKAKKTYTKSMKESGKVNEKHMT